MENNGWVKLNRKSLKSSVWEKPNVWRVWCWCLMKASYKESKFPFNGEDMIIDEGQFITGMKKACKELKLTHQKYRTALLYLKNTSRITIKTTNQFTTISVIKWKEYQITNIQDNKRITNEQQTDNKRITTYKNIKNIKNEKNILSAKADDPKFSFKEIMNEMKLSKRRDIQIISLYWEYKSYEYRNNEQYQSALKRELRSASKLKGYPDKEIIATMDWLEDNADFKWTLETIFKYIDENLNELDSFKKKKDDDPKKKFNY